MDQLISNLANPGSRAFLYVPSSLVIEQAAVRVIDRLIQTDPNLEITVITLGRNQINKPNVSNFQMAQISQVFLDLFFGLGSPRPTGPRILITEASSNLGQFVVPREIGRILVLGSQFKSMEDLTETSRFLSGPASQNVNIAPLHIGTFLGKIGYQLISTQPDFNYQGHTVTLNMVPQQYEEYLQRVAREEPLGRAEPFSALQALNMIYPANLQFLHNLSREQRPNITPDLPIDEGGWITRDINVKNLSPKINWLIQYLQMNPGKHVVYTAFNESNGVQAIASFLRMAGFGVIHITGNDRQQDRYAKIGNFNQQGTQVILISNLYAFNTINGASSLIIFEQHSHDTIFNSYLRQIASSGTQNLPVIFLISLGPQGQPTLDVKNYTHMAQLLNQRDSIFEILRTGQISSQQLQRYRQAFDIPELTLEYLMNLFRNQMGGAIMFRPIPF